KESGRSSLSQPRYAAHAVAAGAVSDRSPANKPIKNAKTSVILSQHARNPAAPGFSHGTATLGSHFPQLALSVPAARLSCTVRDSSSLPRDHLRLQERRRIQFAAPAG